MNWTIGWLIFPFVAPALPTRPASDLFYWNRIQIRDCSFVFWTNDFQQKEVSRNNHHAIERNTINEMVCFCLYSNFWQIKAFTPSKRDCDILFRVCDPSRAPCPPQVPVVPVQSPLPHVPRVHSPGQRCGHGDHVYLYHPLVERRRHCGLLPLKHAFFY